MKLPVHNERRIDEEAAAWLEILSKGGAAEREAFAGWAKESPRHVRAFLMMTALDVELDKVDADKRFETRLDAAHVVPLNSHPQPRAQANKRRRRPLLWAAALAALVLIAVFSSRSIPERYTTSVGEQHAFDLPDESVVYLNTDSEIRLEFSGVAREIRLVSGEALFKVARDTSRPFRVRTDDVVIQAIGTQFNVRRDGYGTKVSVIEGQIKVANQQTPLKAGQEATIQREVHVVKRATADLTRALSWRQRRLMFRTDRLADIAAEFNRYNRSPRIRIEDAILSERRFSGVFDADDPESLVQVLQGRYELRVQRTDREISLRSR